MDCRKAIWLGFTLLSGAAGCGHFPAVTQETSTVSSLPGSGEKVVVKKASHLPKKTPKPKTLVALADFRANEAGGPRYTPAQRREHQDIARKAYQQALEIDDKYLPAYRGLARLYVAMEDLPRAVQTYEKALKLAPTDAEMWFQLGMVQCQQRNWEPALHHLGQAVENDPENRRYVNTLGYACARAGKFEDSYQTFLRVNSSPRAHYKLARMLKHLGRQQLAQRHLQQALHENPRLTEAHALLEEWNQQQPISPESPIHRAGYSQEEAPQPGHTAPPGVEPMSYHAPQTRGEPANVTFATPVIASSGSAHGVQVIDPSNVAR